MLFRTVYGPELEAIYQFVLAQQPVSKTDIINMFLPSSENEGHSPSPQNIDDALSFLVSSYLLQHEDEFFTAIPGETPFKILLLSQLRQLEYNLLPSLTPLDRLYSFLLTEVFIKHDAVFVPNLHTVFNNLREVKEMGGISREKVQAWKRVMEYLGLGYRAFGGFYCVFSPQLIWNIAALWSEPKGTLQDFFENHFSLFLPYQNYQQDVARAVKLPMLHLVEIGYFSLQPLQDSPSRFYFLPDQLREISKNV